MTNTNNINEVSEYIESTPVNDMRAIIKFTLYCNRKLQEVKRGLTEPSEAIASVLGYKRAVNEVLDNDILGYVYDKFTIALLGDTKDREVAKEYFRTTTKLYKDAGGFK